MEENNIQSETNDTQSEEKSKKLKFPPSFIVCNIIFFLLSFLFFAFRTFSVLWLLTLPQRLISACVNALLYALCYTLIFQIPFWSIKILCRTTAKSKKTIKKGLINFLTIFLGIIISIPIYFFVPFLNPQIEYGYFTNNNSGIPVHRPEMTIDKPIIYLYPLEEIKCSVFVGLNGVLTCTYPEYNNGWNDITAKPDGTLIINDKEYYALYWEGIQNVDFDMSQGFCIKGQDTAQFLEEILPKLGLSPKEAEEFIIYWLPKMQGNDFNLISFQSKQYTDNAKLTVVPEPDTIIRVFMVYKPLNNYIGIPPQEIIMPVRKGFTVVEWGGSELR